MQQNRTSHLGLIFILGLLSMLMSLAIDMYLPSMPVIAAQFSVESGSVQMTLSAYMLGFAFGQLFYGPMSDSIGRKPVILWGTLIFAIAGCACAMAQSIDQLIGLRFLHGLAAAAASVVINALMRDMFTKDEFSRMMSFVILVMTIAPLLAPMIGGALLLWFSWHAIFWTMGAAALIGSLLVALFIKETLPKERRQRFHLRTTLGNFGSLFRHKRVLSYMLASAFSFAGMFSFLSAGPFVYIELNHVSLQHFGYYFALNIVFLFLTTLINSRNVRRFGAVKMFKLGLLVQLAMGLWLMAVSTVGLGFWALVIGVAVYLGCIAMISSNAMAVILDDFPHMAGTASSLAGTLCFSIGALVEGGGAVDGAGQKRLANGHLDGAVQHRGGAVLCLRQPAARSRSLTFSRFGACCSASSRGCALPFQGATGNEKFVAKYTQANQLAAFSPVCFLLKNSVAVPPNIPREARCRLSRAGGLY